MILNYYLPSEVKYPTKLFEKIEFTSFRCSIFFRLFENTSKKIEIKWTMYKTLLRSQVKNTLNISIDLSPDYFPSKSNCTERRKERNYVT